MLTRPAPTFEEAVSVLGFSPAQKLMLAQARVANQLMSVGIGNGESGIGSFHAVLTGLGYEKVAPPAEVL